MKETDIIKAIRSHLKNCPGQLNAAFESDAEIVNIGGRLLAFTCDDFSEEDFIPTENPKTLGWNLATAAISDLLAVGAKPEFMMHSLVLSPKTDRNFIEAVSAGIQEALDASGAYMLGGDVGLAAAWRYTGFVVGSFAEGTNPMSRKIPVESGTIVATGDFGDANLAAAAGAGGLRFECRLNQARRINTNVAACIDTSDGLARTIEIIGELNPQVRLILDIDAIPYSKGVKDFAESLSVRPEVMLFGSAGEYELVAFVPESHGLELVNNGGFTAIGTFSTSAASDSGIYYRTADEKLVPHVEVPDPRQMRNFEEYRNAIIALTHRLFG